MAPCVFSKILAVVTAYLRKEGNNYFSLPGRLPPEVLYSLGSHSSDPNNHTLLLRPWPTNKHFKKSTLHPTQQLDFIGAHLYSTTGLTSLPRDRFHTMKILIERVRSSPQVTAWDCLQLLGHLAVCVFIVKNACLYMQCLQGLLATVYKPNVHRLNRLLTMPSKVKDSLLWWTLPLNLCSEVPLWQDPPSVTITADASLTGWGAYMEHLMIQKPQFVSIL